MRVYFDTDVLLDVLFQRPDFYLYAQSCWTLAEKKEVEGMISAISFNNMFYLLRKHRDPELAKKSLHVISDIFHVVPLDIKIIKEALDSGMTDFEDAIQHSSAMQAKADCLLTRNLRDYPADSTIKIITPEVFLKDWAAHRNR